MPLDFPNSPSLNDTFTTENGRVWIWDGSRWESMGVTSGGGSGSITVSETAPEDAEEGDLWFNSVDGSTYIYYDSFWVELVTNSISDGISELESQLETKASTGKAIAMSIVFGG